MYMTQTANPHLGKYVKEPVMTTIQFTKQAKGRKQLAALIAKALQIPVTPMNIDEKAGTVEFP